MLLLSVLLVAAAVDAPAEADRDPVICVNHEVRPTLFTPLRECMRARHWVRVLRSRERNNLRIVTAAQARASLPLSAQYHNVANQPDPLSKWRGQVLDWQDRNFPLGDRVDTAPSFVLPPMDGFPIRR